MRDTVWIPSVPLPLLGRRTDRCGCGKKFRGRNRRHAYELHYRREHLDGDTDPDSQMMEVSREEARRIYAEVYADRPSDGEDTANSAAEAEGSLGRESQGHSSEPDIRSGRQRAGLGGGRATPSVDSLPGNLAEEAGEHA